MLQIISSNATSLSGSTYDGDSDDEFAAELAEEGLAPDSEATLTTALLGALFDPDMHISASASAPGWLLSVQSTEDHDCVAKRRGVASLTQGLIPILCPHAVVAETVPGDKLTAGSDPVQRTAFVVPPPQRALLRRKAAGHRCSAALTNLL